MRRLADNGLAALIGRPVVHTGASAIITEPQEVVDYARRVDRKIDGLQGDFASVYEVDGRAPTLADFNGKISLYTNALIEWGKKQPAPYQQWFVFKTRWEKWVSDTFGADGITDKSFWFQNKWTLYQEVAKFDVEADDWAKTFTKLTGKKPSVLVSSTPDAADVKKKLDAAGGPDLSWVKWAVVAGGVGVGLYVGWPWIAGFRRRAATREELEATRAAAQPRPSVNPLATIPSSQLPTNMGAY